jgi:hypothetical protein
LQFFVPLGNGVNAVRTSKPVFLGHRVSRFRLRMRVEIPNRTMDWVSGLQLTVGETASSPPQLFLDLPAGAAPDGSFWTDWIDGNRTWLSLFSPGLVSFDGGSGRLELLGFERELEPGAARTDVPPADPASEDALHLTLGYEAIGISPEMGEETQHFAISVWNGSHPQVVGIYVSPFLPSLWNDTGVEVGISVQGFKSAGESGGWIRPEPGDTGVYQEIVVPPQTRTLFVTAKSAIRNPYLLSAQALQGAFSDIVIERSGGFSSLSAVDLNDLESNTNAENPYGKNFADFLAGQAAVDRRIAESVVIASAHALDASDGSFRFGGVRLHRSFDSLRDVDVRIENRAGRAHVQSRNNHFVLFRGDVVDPIAGGWTFHHEWSQYEYEMPDEYVDVQGPPPLLFAQAIDANSVMGTRRASEFCYQANHLHSPSTAATGL